MASKLRRVAWDSCVFIDCLEKREGRIEFIEPLVRDAEDGELAIICSALAIAETLHIEGMNKQEEQDAIAAFFRNDYVHVKAADIAVAEMARDIRRRSKLRSEDAIHLATAIQMGCECLLTNDGEGERKGNKKLIPLDREHHDFRICTPQAYRSSQMPLFGNTGEQEK